MPTQHTRPVTIPIGPSIAYVQLTQGLHALIDAVDVRRVQRYNWCAMRKNERVYAVRSGFDKVRRKQRIVLLHRELLGDAVKGLWADHRSGNTLDNRRCNLRPATPQQNSYNTKWPIPKSGAVGVSITKSKRFSVAITVSGRKIRLGIRPSIEEARELYDETAKKLHGEFAVSHR